MGMELEGIMKTNCNVQTKSKANTSAAMEQKFTISSSLPRLACHEGQEELKS